METIEKTNDYTLFKLMPGNRPLNEAHVRRLVDSFKREYLLSPILINKKFEVIDGQHRLAAAQRLNLPVYYIQTNGYGLMEVQLFNTNAKNWNKIDFLNSYCDIGLKPYLQLRQFMHDYPDFGIASAEIICTNNTGGANNKTEFRVKGKKFAVKLFENGGLVIDDLQSAYNNASKLMEYKEFYDGYARSLFVRTMIVLFRHKDFDHDFFIKKLKLQPTALVHCASVEQYRLLIEKIYNYKNHNKVNLRY